MSTQLNIQHLPTELLELVLRDLPLLDLIHAQQACRNWSDILASSASLRRAMYKSALPDHLEVVKDDSIKPTTTAPKPPARLNPLLSTPTPKPIAYANHTEPEFEDGCDTLANCPLTSAPNYPDFLPGVLAAGCAIYTMTIPNFRQRLNETALCSLRSSATSRIVVPSWMDMHVFRRICKRLIVTIQSLSRPGELKCITLENPRGVRLGDLMRGVYIDHAR